jgi:hypothetical protein
MLLLIGCGCSSPYHKGFIHYQRESDKADLFLCGVTNHSAISELKIIENKAANFVITKNIDSLCYLMSDSLKQIFLSAGLKDSVNNLFYSKSTFTGDYHRIKVTGYYNPDDAAFSKPFRYYSFIQTSFVLKCTNNKLVLTLGFEKLSNKIEICKFALSNCIVRGEECMEIEVTASRDIKKPDPNRIIYIKQ